MRHKGFGQSQQMPACLPDSQEERPVLRSLDSLAQMAPWVLSPWILYKSQLLAQAVQGLCHRVRVELIQQTNG